MSSRGDDAPKVHQRLFRHFLLLVGAHYRLRAELMCCHGDSRAETMILPNFS